jgi:cytochrome c oxidase subunit 2
MAMPHPLTPSAVVALAALVGCSGPQSALHPGGEVARDIVLMTWIVSAAGAAIFLAVMALAAWAVFSSPGRWRWGRSLILIGGAGLPILLLTALLLYEIRILPGMAPPPREALRIAVTGKTWWWEVRYLDGQGSLIAASANEIVIPTGAAVAIELSSSDVIHSLWVPSLAGKMDMIPGRRNHARLQADRPGVWRAQCAEYCGLQHARMALIVEAKEPAEFDRWLAGQSKPAEEPRSATARLGRDVFLATGCGACHSIRGTKAEGAIGPDLTHLASRRTIGSGLLANNLGSLAGWVADAQALKPGVAMPPFHILEADQLQALAVYLASLE